MLLGRQVALLSPREGRPRLYDLATGRAAGPISALAAARIAGSLTAIMISPGGAIQPFCELVMTTSSPSSSTGSG